MTLLTLPPVQPSVYDNLFKAIITAGWNVSSDGHVESPQGYFAIVEIPSHSGERAEMVDAIDDRLGETYNNWPEPGWYFTAENSDGIIFVYKVDKSAAELLFEHYSNEYAIWDAT